MTVLSDTDLVFERETANGTRSTSWNAFVPEGTGPYPLVVFTPGFQVSSSAYASLLERLATHGFVVVRADPPAPLLGIDHVEMALDVVGLVAHVQDALEIVVDDSRTGLMGHSLGGKVAVMAAHRSADVDVVFALDPVNGGGPTGYSAARPDIVPDEVSGLTIPLGFVGETTNAKSSSVFSPACAPAEQNFLTFYDAATSSPLSYAWEIVGADHMDFVSDVDGCGFACGACDEGPLAPTTTIEHTTLLMVAFLRATLTDDDALLDYVSEPLVPEEIVVSSSP